MTLLYLQKYLHKNIWKNIPLHSWLLQEEDLLTKAEFCRLRQVALLSSAHGSFGHSDRARAFQLSHVFFLELCL